MTYESYERSFGFFGAGFEIVLDYPTQKSGDVVSGISRLKWLWWKCAWKEKSSPGVSMENVFSTTT